MNHLTYLPSSSDFFFNVVNTLKIHPVSKLEVCGIVSKCCTLDLQNLFTLHNWPTSPHFPHPLKSYFLRVVQMYSHLPHPSPGPRSKCLHFQFSALSSTLCCQAYLIGLVYRCPWQCYKVDRALPSSWRHTRSWCCLSSSQTGPITTTPGLFFPPSPRQNTFVLCPCLSAFCPFLGAGIQSN